MSEYRALLSLKSAISDDPQSSLSSWNASTSHCTWSGVACDSRRHVVALNLTGLNLSVTLSNYVAHLPFLSILSVAANQFSGPISRGFLSSPASDSSTSPTMSSMELFRPSFPSSRIWKSLTFTTRRTPALRVLGYLRQ